MPGDEGWRFERLLSLMAISRHCHAGICPIYALRSSFR